MVKRRFIGVGMYRRSKELLTISFASFTAVIADHFKALISIGIQLANTRADGVDTVRKHLVIEIAIRRELTPFAP